MPEILVEYQTIAGIEERHKAVRGWKDSDGNPHFETQSTGWWITLAPSNTSIHMDSKPDLTIGDLLRITYERVHVKSE